MEIKLYGLLNKAKCLSTTGQQLFIIFLFMSFCLPWTGQL